MCSPLFLTLLTTKRECSGINPLLHKNGLQLWLATGRARRMPAEPAFESIITSTRSSKRTNSTTCEELEFDSNASWQARTVAS